MLEYVVATISLLAGFTGFFYERSSSNGNNISVLGYVLLCLIAFGGIFNGWLIYQSDQAANMAMVENDRLVNEQRIAQSMLMMQFVDLDKPFDHASLNMNIVFDFEDNDEGDHPYSEGTLGTFPVDAVADGETVGQFSFDPSDLESQTYVFVRRDDGIGTTRAAQSKQPEYIFSASTSHNPALDQIDTTQEFAFVWGFESLFTAFGQFSQGPKLSVEPLAGEYLSKLTQQRYLGYLRLDAQASNVRLKSMISDSTNTHIRFIQAYNNALSTKCTRAVYLYVDFVPFEYEAKRLSEAFSRYLYTDAQCEDGDLCYAMILRQPIDVQPCELSKI